MGNFIAIVTAAWVVGPMILGAGNSIANAIHYAGDVIAKAIRERK